MVDDSTKKGVRKAIKVGFGLGIRGIVGGFEVDAKVDPFGARRGPMVLVNNGCRGTRGCNTESDM